MSHIASESKKLAQTDHKRRHDNVTEMIQWRLYAKFMLERPDHWYEHSPETVSENTKHKLLWDMNIQCDHANMILSLLIMLRSLRQLLMLPPLGTREYMKKRKKKLKNIRISNGKFKGVGVF